MEKIVDYLTQEFSDASTILSDIALTTSVITYNLWDEFQEYAKLKNQTKPFIYTHITNIAFLFVEKFNIELNITDWEDVMFLNSDKYDLPKGCTDWEDAIVLFAREHIDKI